MISVTKISAAWIADINANLKPSLGLGDVVTHQPEYDNVATLAELMLTMPAVLLRYMNLTPVESERFGDGGSGLKKQFFSLAFLANSLLSAEEARGGCYAMLDAFRSRYDGGSLTVAGEGQIDLKLEEETFVDSEGGVVVYAALYSFEQI